MPSKPKNLSYYVRLLDSGYKPQINLLNQQQQGLGAITEAKKAGLEQGKVNAFRDITAGANRRGVTFSGVPIQEQSRYVGERYLPALAGVDDEEQSRRFELQRSVAQLLGAQRSEALGLRQDDKTAYRQAVEARKARQFQASQAEKDRQFQAQQAARAASAAAADKNPSRVDYIAEAKLGLANVAGSDKKVHPDDYAMYKSIWEAAGFSGKDFDKEFARFRNPNNPNYPITPTKKKSSKSSNKKKSSSNSGSNNALSFIANSLENRGNPGTTIFGAF